jgi:hypothetical protein
MRNWLEAGVQRNQGAHLLGPLRGAQEQFASLDVEDGQLVQVADEDELEARQAELEL